MSKCIWTTSKIRKISRADDKYQDVVERTYLLRGFITEVTGLKPNKFLFMFKFLETVLDFSMKGKLQNISSCSLKTSFRDTLVEMFCEWDQEYLCC